MNMNNVSPGPFDGSLREKLFSPSDVNGVLRDALAKIFRRLVLLLTFLTAGLVLSVYYVTHATPQYSAQGSILIDPRVGDTPGASGNGTPGLLQSDALTVDSEIQVLASREVTGNAARALGVGAGKEDSAAEEPSLLGQWVDWLKSAIAPAPPAEDLPPDIQAAREFETLRKEFAKALTVERAGDTFVIDLQYTSPDLEFAPEAVNTVMREYLKVSAERKLRDTENTRNWLASRLEDVAADLDKAEKAVAEYRWANSLLAPEGQLLSLNSLLSASTDLVDVENTILALRVNVEHITQLIEDDQLDAIDIPVEDRSRTALVEYEAMLAEQKFKEQELLLRYDPDSEVVANNRLIQARTRELIATELSKVRDRMLTELDVLEGRAKETRVRIASLTDDYGSDLAKLVDLRNLERTAAAKRQLYERLSNEFDAATQLLTNDIIDARVIGWAVVPSEKSSPKSMQVVVLSLFAALILGVSTVFLLDEFDNRFRSASDVRSELGLDLIGLIPNFRSDIKKRRRIGKQTSPRHGFFRKRRGLPKYLSFAVDYPASITAQTLRALHVELSFGKSEPNPKRKNTVVGFTSSLRDEGKTTTAINFATFLAHRGESVVLLDFDFLTFNMSQLLRPALKHENKLMELIAGPKEMIPELKPVPSFPNLYFVGAVSQQPVGAPTPRQLAELKKVIEVLRSQFDMVVIDLPPMRGVSETQLLANLCDKTVFIVNWSKTTKAVAASALRKWTHSKDKFVGVLYTKAKLRAYESFNRDEIHDYYG